jgi:hypothetical protein
LEPSRPDLLVEVTESGHGKSFIVLEPINPKSVGGAHQNGDFEIQPISSLFGNKKGGFRVSEEPFAIIYRGEPSSTLELL